MSNIVEYAGYSPVKLERIVKYELDGDIELAKTALKYLDIWNSNVDIKDYREKFSISEELTTIPLYAKINGTYKKTNTTALFDGKKVYTKYNARLDYYNIDKYLSIVKKITSIVNGELSFIRKLKDSGYESHIIIQKDSHVTISLASVWLFHGNSINHYIVISKDEYFATIPYECSIVGAGKHIQKVLELVESSKTLSYKLFSLRALPVPKDFNFLLMSMYTKSKYLQSAILMHSDHKNVLDLLFSFVKFNYYNDTSNDRQPISNYSGNNFKLTKKFIEWLSEKALLEIV